MSLQITLNETFCQKNNNLLYITICNGANKKKLDFVRDPSMIIKL